MWCADLSSGVENKKCKSGSKGHSLHHVTYFYNFCTLLHLWSGWTYKLQIWWLDWP